MIGIIDYGMGNLGSVENACRFLELDARIVTRPEEMAVCDAVILPGVGAFADCMAHLREHGFVGAITSWIEQGRPFLGICLGLQALFESSEESPGARGLGIFAGSVKRFRLPKEFKVPQIGWNQVVQREKECPLFAGVRDGAFFYFVHSFYVDPDDKTLVAGVTDYGLEYTSAVWRDNVMAVQFHPEKSHDAGIGMLRNFSGWLKNRQEASCCE
ncbi:MAG: imidazole glycerol phosphate synthase subunit HisH [Spartobacteria bacterium]|nr:imidazole glycerol phosphate synthase subunit HisH [Spartobacteria bacterium]